MDKIAPAANRYLIETGQDRPCGNFWADIDFANGATWAAEQLQAENERLNAENAALRQAVNDLVNVGKKQDDLIKKVISKFKQ